MLQLQANTVLIGASLTVNLKVPQWQLPWYSFNCSASLGVDMLGSLLFDGLMQVNL